MPLAIALIAVIGAFASNTNSQKDAAYADKFGYRKVGNNCVPTTTLCSTIEIKFLCTDGSNILYEWNGTSCPDVLYHKMD